MSKFITHDITTYRMNNPNCDYCDNRDKSIPIGKVAECLALRCLCWDSKKKAKKCMLYLVEEYT